MAERFRKGDRVAWDHAQGTSRGRIVEVATRPGRVKGFSHVASEDDPRYIVESETTGARAAHTAAELRREPPPRAPAQA